MNAPENIDKYLKIDLELLHPSKTNPRKRFNEDKLNELAASIKSQGVLQPLLVRKMPFNPLAPDADAFFNHYEIVAGERRYRAAKIANLDEVPCFIRELTDAQVLHAQVIENLQRDDLHPLEEAEGYEKLMKEHGSTAEGLAAEIGKSKAYIYARLKLIDLCTEARTAFFAGELDASTALLIARIPVQRLQIQAVKNITEKNSYDDRAMSFRQARDLLQDEYMTDLSTATFPINDANLLDKVGACSDCLKRTGNQPELFDDVNSKDVCTDTVCFAMKRTAHILLIQKEAEEKGHLVLTGKDAKKVFPNMYNTTLKADSGLVKLSDTCPHDPEERSWEEVLPKKVFESQKDNKPALQKVMVESVARNHELIPTVNIEQATKALREAGFEILPIGTTARHTLREDGAKIKADLEAAKAYRVKLFEALHNRIVADMSHEPPAMNVNFFGVLARAMFDNYIGYDDRTDISCLYLGIDQAQRESDEFDNSYVEEQALDLIRKMTPQQHFIFIMDCLTISESDTNRYDMENEPEMMTEIAKILEIDPKLIKKQAKKSASKPPKVTPAAQAQENSAQEDNAKPTSKAKRKAANAA
jgi:ParB/RepB/Spo0J family partition protein